MINNFRATFSCRIRLKQGLFRRNRGQTFVPKGDWYIMQAFKIAGKCARRLTSGAFAAIHIAGQAQNHARDPACFDDRNYRLGIY